MTLSRKVAALLVSAALLLSVAACGDPQSSEDTRMAKCLNWVADNHGDLSTDDALTVCRRMLENDPEQFAG